MSSIMAENVTTDAHVDIPEYFNFATDVVDDWSNQAPDSTALWWIDGCGNEVCLSYRDLAVSSRKFCNVLQASGVQKGDMVLLVMKPQPAWWEILTACLRMGVVVSPGTSQLSSKDLKYRLKTSAATCVISDLENAGKFEAADIDQSLSCKFVVAGHRDGWISYEDSMKSADEDFNAPNTRAADTALCYFTSGTTGHPKMVIHTQASYGIGHRVTGGSWQQLKPAEVVWCVTDTGWAKAAYSAYFGPIIQGSTVFSVGMPFDAVSTLELLGNYPIDVFCAAPTAYRLLIQENVSSLDAASLKRCFSAGEPLNPEVISQWKKLTRLTIKEGYGQTETCILCASWDDIETRPGSMGTAAPGHDLQVVDQDGVVLDSGEEGEIALRVVPHRPVGLFKEYLNSAERMAESFRGDWYFTGDRAVRDEDGYFWFLSRSDDVIISSGYRIGPFEVESALLEHPAVTESAVVSSPDPVRGEVVKAFVVLSDGFSESEDLVRQLQNHVKRETAPFKYPRRIEFVRELPKTVSGKIRRVELRAMEWADQ